MNFLEKQEFLSMVYNKVYDDPSLMADINEIGYKSINDRVDSEKKHAADMETIAIGISTLIGNKRYSEKHHQWIKRLIMNKIDNFEENSYFGGWKEVKDEIEKM
jgi:hypothetical protein